MSHRVTEARSFGHSGREADRYGHAGGPPVGPQGAPAGPPVDLATPPPIGTVPELDPNDFYVKWDSAINSFVPARPGEPGAQFDDSAWAAAKEARADVAGGFPGATGPAGPTAAELAIERSKVQATNLSTFIQGTIAELTSAIDAKRLSTDQALDEFNRRLDAFAEAGTQFQGIQPYTIPIGAEYVPGFGPGEVGEELGITPERAEVIQYDPFGMAAEIVAETPVLTDIGVPSGDALSRAIEVARGFVGG